MNISTRKIEIFLAKYGMDKADLSQASGMTRQSISTILQRKTCKPKTAGRIARALGVDVTEIIEQEE